jgi:hypothetical protein
MIFLLIGFWMLTLMAAYWWGYRNCVKHFEPKLRNAYKALFVAQEREIDYSRLVRALSRALGDFSGKLRERDDDSNRTDWWRNME